MGLSKCSLCNQVYSTKKARTTANERLLHGIIASYKDWQTKNHLPCPKCGEDSMSDSVSRNALSRVASIQICDVCGVKESLEAFMGEEASVLNWWLINYLFGVNNAN